MNHISTSIAALLLGGLALLLGTHPVGAVVDVSGNLKADSRWRPDDERYTRNETRLALKLDARSTKTFFHAESRLRYFAYPEVSNSAQLRDTDWIQPWRHELYEAYADVYGFLLDNVDLRVGKQRIAWGTADKMNVVDNLNPDDFEDILDFTEKIPTLGLRMDYYPGEFTVTGVIIPVFTPARSLSSSWEVTPAFPLPQGLALRTLDDNVHLPENRPRDAANLGIRIQKPFLNYDWSLSYVYSRDEWALPTRAEILPVDTLGTTDVHLTLEYPRQHIIGADMAGTIGDVGVWAEGAMFFPEEEIYTHVISPSGTQSQLALDDEPYFKFVVGGDYTFTNGLYVNAQYMHGFFTDRGVDNLEDYFLIALEKKFIRDELKVRMTMAAEIADFEDTGDNSAYFGGPELTYSPVDDFEFVIGGLLLEGDASTQFGQFNNNDEIYFQMTFSF